MLPVGFGLDRTLTLTEWRPRVCYQLGSLW